MLLIADLTGVIVGFIIYHFAKPANQLVIQIPVAVILSIVLFTIWVLLIRVLPFKNLRLRTQLEFVGVFVTALLWNPLVFVPLHYFTQGYLTKWSLHPVRFRYVSPNTIGIQKRCYR